MSRKCAVYIITTNISNALLALIELIVEVYIRARSVISMYLISRFYFSDIVVKKVTDLSKIKITIPQLQKGKYTLKRRC